MPLGCLFCLSSHVPTAVSSYLFLLDHIANFFQKTSTPVKHFLRAKRWHARLVRDELILLTNTNTEQQVSREQQQRKVGE
jgi:hypothetical protein